MAVGNGAHDRPDRQAVEVVVNENQHAEKEGCEQRPYLAVNVFHGPAPECCRATGCIDQRNHNPQQNKEHENACVPAVRNRADKAVIDHGIQ